MLVLLRAPVGQQENPAVQVNSYALVSKSESADQTSADRLTQHPPTVHDQSFGHSESIRGTGLNAFGRHEMIDSSPTQFELRFQSLFDSGRGYSFPCDPAGQVNLGLLSDRARNNYLFARAMVGRELAVPAVRPSGLH